MGLFDKFKNMFKKDSEEEKKEIEKYDEGLKKTR